MHGRTYIEKDLGLDLYRKKYNHNINISIGAWICIRKS